MLLLTAIRPDPSSLIGKIPRATKTIDKVNFKLVSFVVLVVEFSSNELVIIWRYCENINTTYTSSIEAMQLKT